MSLSVRDVIDEGGWERALFTTYALSLSFFESLLLRSLMQIGCQETLLVSDVPAAERAGIGKIGWHTFRHTYSTMLRSMGVDVKVQQELLRHADIQTTLNTYTQAVSEAKREGNSKVVRMVLPLSGSRTDAKAAV